MKQRETTHRDVRIINSGRGATEKTYCRLITSHLTDVHGETACNEFQSIKQARQAIDIALANGAQVIDGDLHMTAACHMVMLDIATQINLRTTLASAQQWLAQRKAGV